MGNGDYFARRRRIRGRPRSEALAIPTVLGSGMDVVPDRTVEENPQSLEAVKLTWLVGSGITDQPLPVQVANWKVGFSWRPRVWPRTLLKRKVIVLPCSKFAHANP